MKEYCNREEDTSHVTVPSVGSKELVERFRQKFMKEARIIWELLEKENNNHIVRIFDVFEEHGTAYYVMEYLPGGDLRSLIPTGGMKESEALSYIRQIADALLFVHDRNILHLDVKPGNVLFRSNGEAVLVDFGLSKHYDESSGKQTSSTPLGISEGYAPTEQYENSGVSSFSPATDIYSLGATFYCLLQGSRPPKASIVLNDGLPSLPAHVSSIVRTAIETAMQPRRNDRPQSVEAFLSLLDSSLENVDEGTVIDVVPPEPDRPVLPPPVPPTPGHKPFPWKWSLPLIACLVFVLGLFGWNKFVGSDSGGDTLSSVTYPIILPIPESSKLSVTGRINGHDYVDLGLSVKWATMNVGAKKPSDYGNYYAWGEINPKHEYTVENCLTTDKEMGNICGNLHYDAARCHWGDSWRLPNKEEVEELWDKCIWEWTEIGGHNGAKVTGPNGNSLFFPAAGDRYKNENKDLSDGIGEEGWYMTGSPETDGLGKDILAYGLTFEKGAKNMGVLVLRAMGISIRPVSD